MLKPFNASFTPPAIQPQATSLQRNGNALPDCPRTLQSLCRELITKQQQLAKLYRYENALYKMGLKVLESEALSQGGRSFLNTNVRSALEKETMELHIAIIQHPLYKILKSQPKSSDPDSDVFLLQRALKGFAR